MPHGKKNTGKGKEKAVPNLKRPASTHDLRNESTIVDGDKIPATMGTVREPEPPAEEPTMILVTPRKQVRSSLTRIRMEASESRSQKGGRSTLGTPGIPETPGTPDLPRTPRTPGTPGTPQLLRTLMGAYRAGSRGRTDESPHRNMFSNGNGVSSPVALLESPIRPPMGLVGGKPNAAEVTKGHKRNRSITQFTGVLRDIIESAGNKIEYITLFEELFPDPQRVEDILAKVWREAERHHEYDQTHDNRIDAYLRSVQSRTRSHLVSEAQRNIVCLYQFDQNTSKVYIQNHVGPLLKQD
ncbi:hypothetical protein L211DRAFT_854461 [Terfezia boudieri ATCC MYA-4762]|uniref:DUF6532 domain-containing protein n=1 Tax=Terfezia boudieri ATCC MYA-4762 TaxID=1051890 RepID=A0A3N4L5E7_9PEZI|nr:hypothetical protein L211DRAFT_854461 [Terfezia boudieri ATCC MYA-4762]